MTPVNETPNPYVERTRVMFNDIGRPLEDDEWLRNFETGITDLAEKHDMEYDGHLNPAITYVIWKDIKKAQSESYLPFSLSTTSEVINHLISEEVIDERLAVRSLFVRVSSIRLTHLGDSRAKYHVRARIEDIERPNHWGTLLVNERRAVQKALGVNRSIKYNPAATQPIDLIIGTIDTKNKPISLTDFTDLSRYPSRIMEPLQLGRIKAYDAFRDIGGRKPRPFRRKK